MKKIYLLKIINSLSLAFLIFISIVPINIKIEWVSLIYISSIIIIFISYIFWGKFFPNFSYASLTSNFNKEVGLVFASIFICIFESRLKMAGEVIILFIIIFLVSSILLLRILRTINFDADNSKLIKINLLYGISIIGFAILLSIESVRTIIFNGINIVVNLFIPILKLLIYGIAALLEPIIMFLVKLIKVNPTFNKILEQISISTNKKIFGDIKGHIPKDSHFIDVLSKVMFFAILAYILIRIIRHFLEKFRLSESGQDYIECKEFIKSDKKNKKKSIGNLETFKPRSYSESIRNYYKKFLKLCITNGIDLLSTDTTQQINKKSSNKFDIKVLEKIRKIYVKVRYNDDIGDKKSANDMADYYKQLRRDIHNE